MPYREVMTSRCTGLAAPPLVGVMLRIQATRSLAGGGTPAPAAGPGDDMLPGVAGAASDIASARRRVSCRNARKRWYSATERAARWRRRCDTAPSAAAA